MDTPISFYFGVPEGKRANLDTIALVSVEWVNLVRDLASVIDPDLEFEIEFVESADGSVWLTNLIKALHGGDRKALAALVAAVVTFFGSGPALHIQTDLGDEFWKKLGHEHGIEISEGDKQDIADRVNKAIEETSAEERRRKIISYVEPDENVTSVGVDINRNTEGPISRIPRESFASYDASPTSPPDRPEKDVVHERNIDVKIIKASLREGETRPRWRFKQDGEEWSAFIEDEEFIWALNETKTGIPLAVGQHISVDIAIDMKLINGEWEKHDRRVLRVHNPRIKRAQGELGFGGQ